MRGVEFYLGIHCESLKKTINKLEIHVGKRKCTLFCDDMANLPVYKKYITSPENVRILEQINDDDHDDDE